jgi:hypothetical protein
MNSFMKTLAWHVQPYGGFGGVVNFGRDKLVDERRFGASISSLKRS